MPWEIELEAEYSLTLYTLCEGSGLPDKKLRLWLVSASAHAMCLYIQPAEDPHLQIIGSVPDS